MSEKKLLTWFEKRREANIIKGTQEHIQIVYLCYKEFKEANELIFKGEKGAGMSALERSMRYERDADQIEIRIYEELTKGELEPKDRYDLIRLVRLTDYIADWTKTSCKNLKIITSVDIKVDDTMDNYIKSLNQVGLEAVEHLKTAMNHLGTDDHACLSELKRVNQLERKADDIYFEAKTYLFTKDLSARTLVLLRDYLHSIEQITDYCKSAAEVMDLLLVSGR